MSRKYFGTDGVRGKVGEFPITPEFAMKLGWAAGRVLSQRGTKKVLIGKDTRISGYLLETALEAGLVAAGVDVRLLGPMPTPAVSYLTRTFRAEAGIVISASHNPYYDNGIKFFSADGTKLPDDVELAIEEAMEQPMVCESSERLGKAMRILVKGFAHQGRIGLPVEQGDALGKLLHTFRKQHIQISDQMKTRPWRASTNHLSSAFRWHDRYEFFLLLPCQCEVFG